MYLGTKAQPSWPIKLIFTIFIQLCFSSNFLRKGMEFQEMNSSKLCFPELANDENPLEIPVSSPADSD